MEVKEAVKTAKEYIIDLFSDETITDIGLEEVRLDIDLDQWEVTIGFHRPWDHRNKLTTALGEQYPARSYKVVVIHARSGHVLSITDRVLPAST